MPGIRLQASESNLMSPSNQPTSSSPVNSSIGAGSQWIFTDTELAHAPSIIDGMDAEKERTNRGKGVNFILQVGVMLRLPQTTLATASVFLHRFYMRHSMVEGVGRVGYHYYPMAATSLFLATKVEETCRKMKELVIACVRVAQKDPTKAVDEQDREYWRWRDNIQLNEDLLLEALCFDLTLESPYTTLFKLLTRFGEDQNKRLRNAAWAFVNDSCLTMLCLIVPSKALAAAAMFAAAKLCCVTFPDDSHERPWWQAISVKPSDIMKACTHMCKTYEHLPVRGSREEGLYTQLSREIVADLAATRQALASKTNGEQQEHLGNGTMDWNAGIYQNNASERKEDNNETKATAGLRDDNGASGSDTIISHQHISTNGALHRMSEELHARERIFAENGNRPTDRNDGSRDNSTLDAEGDDLSEEGEVEA